MVIHHSRSTSAVFLKNVVAKDPTQYAGKLIRGSGNVIQIQQFHNPTWALVVVMDDNANVAVVAYDGDAGSIVKGDTVTFVGTPVCEWDYQNLMNGTTQSVLYDGVSLTKQSQ
jgi:hypothetical protein